MEKEEYLYINLFDEKVTVETNETGDEHTSHSSKHWIGGTAIPLSAILLGGKVEGQIGLQVPPLLMGYVLGDAFGSMTSTNAMLDLYVNIDTTYSKPESSKQQVNKQHFNILESSISNFKNHFHF